MKERKIMKYGESIFDILYLLIVVVIAIKILSKGNNKLSKRLPIYFPPFQN